MPDLNFRVTGVKPAARGLIPLLHFHVEVNNSPETELIQAVILQAQIQIQSARRPYDDQEREKLSDLFGLRADGDKLFVTVFGPTRTRRFVLLFKRQRRSCRFSAPMTSTSLRQSIFTR